jgi:hypothetical protein
VGRPKYLLKSQANTLVGVIREAGLDRTDFDWQKITLTDWWHGEGNNYVADALAYRSPETFFAFGRDRVTYSPGNERLRDEWAASDWRQTVLYFAHWLNNIKREARPSLWESIAESTTLSAGALDTPPTRFTQEEQDEILTRLETMARQIEALDSLTREQKQLVSTELRNIGNAVNRMERGEWFRFAIGGMVAVLLSSGLQHTLAASLMRWAVAAFQSMVTGHPMPPLLLP